MEVLDKHVVDVPQADVKRLDHNLHASCGCHWEARGKTPAQILKDAITHNLTTGHVVSIMGEIR